MRVHCLSCAWGVGAADESVVRGFCAGISVTGASVVLSSLQIMVGLVVGRYVFVTDLCFGCL